MHNSRIEDNQPARDLIYRLNPSFARDVAKRAKHKIDASIVIDNHT